MKVKFWILLLAVLVMQGCSSQMARKGEETKVQAERNSVPAVTESVFEARSGTLLVSFDEQGQWIRITSKGSSLMENPSPSGRDSALMMATMRARRTVAEFINTDLRSSSTLARIAKSYSRQLQSMESQADATGDDASLEADEPTTEQSRQARRVAETLRERIQESSAAILKGGYVTHRSSEDGRAVVELTITRESIRTAKELGRLMSGGL